MTGVRYKCKKCGWHSYRKSILPCAKCGGDVELFPSTLDRRPFTSDEEKFIRANYKKMIYRKLAEALGRSESVVTNYLSRNGLRISKSEYQKRHNDSLFKKGHITWNKGLSLPNKPNTGQFTKGNKPVNTKPVGFVSVRYHKRDMCNYLWIKLSDRNWQLLNRYNWEKAYGHIPKKHVIRFKDRNTLNCNIDNLELISMRDNLVRNCPEVRKDLVTYSDRYIAARMGISGKKTQDKFIEEHPELIELKRQQLLLQRGIKDETRRAS